MLFLLTILNANDARANLYKLIDQKNQSHETVIISGKRNNAVKDSEKIAKSGLKEKTKTFQNPPLI
jgi:hypothetical protein